MIRTGATTVILPEDLAILKKRFAGELHIYAVLRSLEVRKGKETPEVASLLVQKFGYGMHAAIRLIDRTQDTALHDDFLQHVEAAMELVNPDWRRDQQARWDAQKVSLVFDGIPRKGNGE